MTDQDTLIVFLTEQKYMTIAVMLADGTPWATPVRIKAHEGKTFEWESKTDTEHSKAISASPIIAISMFTPSNETTAQLGFYAQATAKQIGEPNEHGIARYRAAVNTCFINDATFIKREVELA
ncbi:pyridoxamine 5'-phosphate oxidase family protein [Candidatus Saccharibacteria bacterium]|nr:pyridoxamine 5'-phosphate oxidase family protein [Candidatus Saccharibacteria bacterium]